MVISSESEIGASSSNFEQVRYVYFRTNIFEKYEFIFSSPPSYELNRLTEAATKLEEGKFKTGLKRDGFRHITPPEWMIKIQYVELK